MQLLSSADYFQNYLEDYQSEMGWIQIRADILLVLIWVRAVCKGYQRTKKVIASKVRVKVAPKVAYRPTSYMGGSSWGDRLGPMMAHL